MERIRQLFSSIQLSHIDRDKLARWGKRSVTVCLVMLTAYVVASLTSLLVMTQFAQMTLESIKRTNPRPSDAQSMQVNVRSQMNYLDLRRTVLDRNIFNSEGLVPDETNVEPVEQAVSDFNFNAPCQKPTVNVELVGTIYLGSPTNSLAVVRERGYAQSDVYKVGETLIGNENARVMAVEQQRAILNHNGNKECLELVGPVGTSPMASSPVGSDLPDADSRPGSSQVPQEGSDSERTVVLKASYVEEQLGEGFSEILKKGRLVPANDPETNTMQGFRLIGLVQDSLFGRIGLQNGDVITGVNDISLQQPDQGFAFYQVFQDSQENRISLLRNGTQPVTINVRIE